MRGWWRLIFFAALTAAILWMMRTPGPPKLIESVTNEEPVSSELGLEFLPSRCGTLTCKVVWDGPRPVVPSLSMFQAKSRPGGKMSLPNPNAPTIAQSGGLANAVVFLRGIDLKKSRSWDLPPVRVEVNATDMIVHSGGQSGSIGIVRRGETVELLSRARRSWYSRPRGGLLHPNAPDAERSRVPSPVRSWDRRIEFRLLVLLDAWLSRRKRSSLCWRYRFDGRSALRQCARRELRACLLEGELAYRPKRTGSGMDFSNRDHI